MITFLLLTLYIFLFHAVQAKAGTCTMEVLEALPPLQGRYHKGPNSAAEVVDFTAVVVVVVEAGIVSSGGIERYNCFNPNFVGREAAEEVVEVKSGIDFRQRN